jgi:hypothetical protein
MPWLALPQTADYFHFPVVMEHGIKDAQHLQSWVLKLKTNPYVVVFL